MSRPFHRPALALAAALCAMTGLSAPALAADGPSARLKACASGSCLAVSGRRPNATAAVFVNGHPVEVDGKRAWQVLLPLAAVRAWSPPMARTIAVATYDPATQSRTSDEADLPIGLLGHVELASLVVAVK